MFKRKKAPATMEVAGALDFSALNTEMRYCISMKLRSLSLRLGCLSLRNALASI